MTSELPQLSRILGGHVTYRIVDCPIAADPPIYDPMPRTGNALPRSIPAPFYLGQVEMEIHSKRQRLRHPFQF